MNHLNPTKYFEIKSENNTNVYRKIPREVQKQPSIMNFFINIIHEMMSAVKEFRNKGMKIL